MPKDYRIHTPFKSILCCDCGERVPLAQAISADPANPPTAEDKARISLVGPVKGLYICADRKTCKAVLSCQRLLHFVKGCAASRAFRRA